MKKESPACPVETTLMLISDRWKVLIIRDLLGGTKRFGELKKSIGTVSQKVLTSNLRSMEESGLLTRKVYAEVPPRVEYTLTETGFPCNFLNKESDSGHLSGFLDSFLISYTFPQISFGTYAFTSMPSGTYSSDSSCPWVRISWIFPASAKEYNRSIYT